MTKKGSIQAAPEITVHGGATAAAMVTDSVRDAPSSLWMGDQEEIARLAHEYWEARGCPDGSPEEDWFRAEKALKEQAR